LLGLAELLPLLLTAFVGGALADSMDRRRLVLATEVGLGLGSGALALAALSEHPPVWTLYAVAAVMSALNGLQRPSLEALAPRLVDADEMPAIASRSSPRPGSPRPTSSTSRPSSFRSSPCARSGPSFPPSRAGA
jgi:MFS family permease